MDSSMCPICDQYEEYIEHLLFFVFLDKSIWFESPLNYIVNPQRFTTIRNWLASLFNPPNIPKCDLDWLLTLISFILWEIGKARCGFIFKGRRLEPKWMITKVVDAASEFQGTIGVSITLARGT